MFEIFEVSSENIIFGNSIDKNVLVSNDSKLREKKKSTRNGGYGGVAGNTAVSVQFLVLPKFIDVIIPHPPPPL